MKKIAVFLHSRELSGASLAILDCLKYYQSDKYELYIVLPFRSKKISQALNKMNIDLNHIIIGNYMVRYKCSTNNPVYKKIMKFIFEKTINKISLLLLKNKLKKLEITLIHSNSFATYQGAEVAKKMNIPHVWHIREFMEEDDLVSHYYPQKIKKLAEYSHAIYISDIIKERYDKLYKFKSTLVIYDNVNYDKNYTKCRKFMEDGICNMLFVGLTDTNKNALDVVKCSKKLNDNNYPNVLYICGNKGNQYEKISNYINENNLKNVTLLGYREKINELRKNTDIAFMCSYSEAFGRTTVEAQYYYNLIIGAISDKSSAKNLITDMENGLLYERGNIDELYEKVVFAINHKDISQKIINKAHSYAVDMYNNNILDLIFKYYDSILERKDM